MTPNIVERIAAALNDAVERTLSDDTRAHRQWLFAKLERLQELLAKDPAQAKIEIARRLDGNLALRALPSPTNERDDWEISGGVKANGLLAKEEAVAFQ